MSSAINKTIIESRKEMNKLKKKLVVGILTGAILLGSAGTYAFAQTNEDGNGGGKFNFGQLLPHMKEVHPDLSTKELKQMYNSCHGEDGNSEKNTTSTENMMNNL